MERTIVWVSIVDPSPTFEGSGVTKAGPGRARARSILQVNDVIKYPTLAHATRFPCVMRVRMTQRLAGAHQGW